MPELNNKVQLTGHLGSNPDIRVTDKGKKHARFSLATNEFYRNSNGDTISNTYWHNLVAWGKNAEVAPEFSFNDAKRTLNVTFQLKETAK